MSGERDERVLEGLVGRRMLAALGVVVVVLTVVVVVAQAVRALGGSW